MKKKIVAIIIFIFIFIFIFTLELCYVTGKKFGIKKGFEQGVNRQKLIENAEKYEARLREDLAGAEGIKRESVLCTNYTYKGYDPQDEVLNLRVDTKIYDVGFIAYSKEFAKRFGYPNTHVYPLDKGVHVMEFRVITRGIWQDIYLNILLDNDLGLDVPEIPYYMRESQEGLRFRLPDKIKGFKLSEEDWKYIQKVDKEPHGWEWENYYSRNNYLASLDYVPIDVAKWKGACASTILREYSNKYYKDFDYFSINIFDFGYLDKMLLKGAALWLKKKGGADYSQKLLKNPDEFLKFKIPQELSKKILPIMKEFDFYSNYNNIMERFKRFKQLEDK